MKYLCAISGINITCSHMPGYLSSREAYHPIFTIPQKHLLSYIPKWAAHELTETDSYLLYLALFNSTGLIDWRAPAKNHSAMKALVASNMESLARAIGKINTVTHPKFTLPRIAITTDTADFANSRYWIEHWHNAFAEFQNGYRDAVLRDKVVRREQTLDRLIRDPNMPIEKYARVLADWAADAGEFPTHYINMNGKRITLADYWKDIIIRCCKDDRIFAIPEAHLDKLLEWCEENVDAGSNYGFTLFKLLRSGAKKQANFLGLEDIDFDETHPGFRILPKAATKDDANVAALIAGAPTSKPIESNYPTKIAYLRAKMKWDIAEEDRKNKEKEAAQLAQLTPISVEQDTIEDNQDDGDSDNEPGNDEDTTDGEDDDNS